MNYAYSIVHLLFCAQGTLPKASRMMHSAITMMITSTRNESKIYIGDEQYILNLGLTKVGWCVKFSGLKMRAKMVCCGC